jgi:hypothetical protein
MTVPDDAPRSGHRTCSSSIENRHQTKFVITYGVIGSAVIRSAVIATALRHPSKKVLSS